MKIERRWEGESFHEGGGSAIGGGGGGVVVVYSYRPGCLSGGRRVMN